MKTALHWRLLGVVASFIPWAFSLPYIVNAWHHSPMDRYDSGFVFLAAALYIYVYLRRREGLANDGMDWLTYIAIAFTFGILSIAFLFSIHMVYIAASVAFAWSVNRALLGRPKARGLFYPSVILMLATTSSSYWIGFFTGMDTVEAVVLKVAVALIVMVACFCNINFRLEPYIFAIAALVAIAAWYQAGHLSVSYPALRLDFMEAINDSSVYYGRLNSNTSAMERFFAHSDVRSFSFASDERDFVVLDVKCGKDIHEIHPASHCLRSSGAQVVSEHQEVYNIHGNNYSLLEIVVQRKTGRELFAVWYSNERNSYSSFLAFRNNWNSDIDWYTWQVSTKCGNNIEVARAAMSEFLNSIPFVRQE